MTADKHVPVASVAWYKIADLISRGEREKALSFYRLLSHSLDDKAYALQLEGDILWALDDNRAKEKYFQAARLYRQDKRWVDAAMLGEHLLSQYPGDPGLLVFVAYCYGLLDLREKTIEYLRAFRRVVDQKNMSLQDYAQEVGLLESLAQHKAWLANILKSDV